MANKKTEGRTLVDRKHLRLPPDGSSIAQLDLELGATFRPTRWALILDESYGGCKLAILDDPKIQPGSTIQSKVGPLDPMRAVVKWKQPIDVQLARIGLMYVE